MLAHDCFFADNPGIFDPERGEVGFRFLRQPTLELQANTAKAPKIVLLSADGHVRPGPIKAPVINVILGKVLGQHFTVEPMNGMKIARVTARGRGARVGDFAEVIGENRTAVLQDSHRRAGHFLETESDVGSLRGLFRKGQWS